MNKRRKKYKIKVVPVIIAIVILILILGALVGTIMSMVNKNDKESIGITNDQISQNVEKEDDEDDKDKEDDKEEEVTTQTNTAIDSFLPAGSLDDWNLILLNTEEANSIPRDIPMDKVKFDTQYMYEKLKEPYTDMYEAAKKDGITLYIRSGYRTISTQQVTYQASIQRYMEQGMSRDEATAQTNLYTEQPGSSDHHTGLAIDVITPEYHMHIYNLDERFAETEAYSWLIENSVNYGFILRYPADKTEITKMSYEPWHFRYVGVEHALYMKENNLCLEEYISLLKSYDR